MSIWFWFYGFEDIYRGGLLDFKAIIS